LNIFQNFSILTVVGILIITTLPRKAKTGDQGTLTKLTDFEGKTGACPEK